MMAKQSDAATIHSDSMAGVTKILTSTTKERACFEPLQILDRTNIRKYQRNFDEPPSDCGFRAALIAKEHATPFDQRIVCSSKLTVRIAVMGSEASFMSTSSS